MKTTIKRRKAISLILAFIMSLVLVVPITASDVVEADRYGFACCYGCVVAEEYGCEGEGA